MTSLKLDEKNNLQFINDFELVSDDNAVIQDIRTLLPMWQTEYPFEIGEGIAWYNIANSNRKRELENAVLERLLSDSRVDKVEDLTLEFDGFKAKISAKVITTNGSVIYV